MELVVTGEYALIEGEQLLGIKEYFLLPYLGVGLLASYGVFRLKLSFVA